MLWPDDPEIVETADRVAAVELGSYPRGLCHKEQENLFAQGISGGVIRVSLITANARPGQGVMGSEIHEPRYPI
jgi:hypothetical protein